MATPLPDRDHRISLENAERIVKARRDADKGKPDAEVPFAFNRKGLELLLGQKGCVGIRAYPAQHEKGDHSWVLVGVDEKGNDMTSGTLLQEPYLCPIYCPDTLLGEQG